MILIHVGLRVFVSRRAILYLDFISLCFYGLACLVMTAAQLAFLRHLTVDSGRKIEELTYTDELTGLANRRHIAKFLTDEFREAQLSKNPLSLLFLDLDKFKPVNDQHGHAAGDLVLRAVAHSLRETVREADFVGRVGGDEFVVVLPDTDSQCASVVAHRTSERIKAISVTVNHTAITELTCSIGISSYPANANTREELIQDADRSMYAAKNSGDGNIVVSITRPAGPEPKAPAGETGQFESQIRRLVDRENNADQPPQPGEHGNV